MEARPTPIQEITDARIEKTGVGLLIKREDLNHSIVSGNKLRKLKYNLEEAKLQEKETILTFGGAFSNHIYAVAGAGKIYGFKTIGIIRGEEHLPLNPTLSFAKEQGMEIHYMDRSTYRSKNSEEVTETLRERFGDFYLVPEGGTNALAIKGCAEIISEIDSDFDIICCPVGTGGTITGLISGLEGKNRVLGFSSLKGEFLKEEVADFLHDFKLGDYQNWSINTDYHFGGYAKTKPELLNFIGQFEQQHAIPLEPIYTGKMMFGLFDLIEKGYFQKGTTLMAIHTGGLQGNLGFNR